MVQSQPLGAQILVVDDTPDNLFLIQTVLEDEGYTLTLAHNGPTALAIVEASPPDLILLDVMMPGMDGYEVTRRIRQSEHLPFIPILLITAHERSDVVQGLDTGADDFLRKPVEVDELLARVRALLRLKHSIDAEKAIVQQREDFVSRLTHDLRTPLVASDRMLGLIAQGAFGAIAPETQSAITHIIRSNQNLLNMVNTLLEVYRHESGRKTMTFAAFNLATLAQDILHELKPLADEKGLGLTLVIPEAEATATSPMYKAVGDCIEMRRVLTNLVGNAIKFTDQGSVEIHIRRTPVTDSTDVTASHNWIRVDICDTGIGISPEEQTSLFEWFRQGNHHRSGSGLGLHLSRRIVEAHHGQLTVVSTVGQGSTFTLQIPAHQ